LTGSDSHNLTDYLRAFSSPERLHGVNAYECDKCCRKTIEKAETTTKTTTNRRRTVDAEKRYLVHLPPNVLTVHLKRFQQVFCGTRRGRVETRKLNTPVRYPLILDLSPYCHRSAQRISSPDNRVLYSLYGVVCHSGNLSGGHYISYTKCRSGDAQRLIEQLQSARLNEAFRPSSTTTTEPLPSARLNEGFRPSSSTKTTTTTEPLCRSGDAQRLTEQLQSARLNEAFRPSSSTTMTTTMEPLPTTITEPLPGEWWYASDCRVRKVDETVVLAQQTEAYILFYERVL